MARSGHGWARYPESRRAFLRAAGTVTTQARRGRLSMASAGPDALRKEASPAACGWQIKVDFLESVGWGTWIRSQ